MRMSDWSSDVCSSDLEGDPIRVTGPFGRFFVRKSAQMPMIFMAGGSGLSSPRSMILDLLEEGCALPLTLIYGQRTIEELYYHGEFVALAAKHTNFTYIHVLSHAPESGAWDGERGSGHELGHRPLRGGC